MIASFSGMPTIRSINTMKITVFVGAGISQHIEDLWHVEAQHLIIPGESRRQEVGRYKEEPDVI